MNSPSLTPTEFNREVDKAIRVCGDRVMLGSVAELLVIKALGHNALAYVDGIDRLCRRLRELNEKPEFGPPTKASIADAKAAAGEGRVAL